MIRFAPEQGRREKPNAQGSNGIARFRDLFTADELGGRAEMFSVVAVLPGDSVGIHAHTANGEVYCVLSGSVWVTENGEERQLLPGDAEFCADGNTHGMENRSDTPAEILAVILPNR